MQTAIPSMEKFNKASMESLERLGEINLNAARQLISCQMEIANEYVQGSIKHMELLGSSKGLQDLVAGQVKLATEMNEKLLGHARNVVQVTTETREELKDWFEDGVKNTPSAFEQVTAAPVAKSAKKA